MNLVLVALELLARMGMLGISLSWGGGDRRMGRSTPELCPNPEQADVDPKFQVGAVPSPGWHLGPMERSWCPLREGKRGFHLLGLPQELTESFGVSHKPLGLEAAPEGYKEQAEPEVPCTRIWKERKSEV